LFRPFFRRQPRLLGLLLPHRLESYLTGIPLKLYSVLLFGSVVAT
jgi:hypothetical protein